jgi:hypothetical protein
MHFPSETDKGIPPTGLNFAPHFARFAPGQKGNSCGDSFEHYLDISGDNPTNSSKRPTKWTSYSPLLPVRYPLKKQTGKENKISGNNVKKITTRNGPRIT